jgi:hypothetical protein
MMTEGGSVHETSAVALHVQLGAEPLPGFWGPQDELVIFGGPSTHGGSHAVLAETCARVSAFVWAAAQLTAVAVMFPVVLPGQAAGEIAFSRKSFPLQPDDQYETLDT